MLQSTISNFESGNWRDGDFSDLCRACVDQTIHQPFSVYHIFNPFVCEDLDDGCTLSTNKPKWIITDIRFPENEGTAVTSRGGLLIGIRRYFALKQPKYAHLVDENKPYDIPSKLEELDNKLYKSLTHESETSMTDHSWCDVVIENNGTIEDLFNNVLNAVTSKVEV